jgi:CubicO group peptidase (beta-lactamase class C family)
VSDPTGPISGDRVPVDVARRPLVPFPSQPAATPWPTERWPEGDVPAGVDLDELLAEAFAPEGPIGETYAVAVVHRGRLVVERYAGALPRFDGPGREVTAEVSLLSWSVAKSMLHAVVGMLVGEGRLVLGGAAGVATWQGPGDPRALVTLEHLLTMRDGLAWDEDYEDAERSDVIQMLFGRGKADLAGFAADRPLAAAPGTRFNYSTGTSMIVSGLVGDEVGRGDPYRRFLGQRLFDPVGMTSATATFDDVGVWAAGSFVHATARDYARFGLLALRDGVWDGRRLLPEGWMDHGRTPRSIDLDDGTYYGAHWWSAGHPLGTFWAAGHEGQYIDVCPALDLVLVRLGHSTADHADALLAWRTRVIEAFGGGRFTRPG